MKKSLLTPIAMVVLSSILPLVTKNYQTAGCQQINSTIQTIAQEYENNPQKVLNYLDIAKSIYHNKILTKIINSINIYSGNELASKYGHPERGGYYQAEENYFTYNNTKYNINVDTSEVTQFNTFNNLLKIELKNKIGDLINHSLVLSVISELAHYYSVNSNSLKITKTINIIKELIQNINNYDTGINKSGSFMNEIQSWNLTNVINDYNNKIFTNKIDQYRHLNYDNLVTSASTNFDVTMINGINNADLTTTHPWAFMQYITILKGSANIYQTITMQDSTSSQTIFNITFHQRISIYTESHIYFGDEQDVKTLRKDLQFDNLNNFDLTSCFK